MMETGSSNNRRHCFFDVSIDGESAGRVVMEMFDELAPWTCQNFVLLCTGQRRTSMTTTLHYKGSVFHRVVKGFMIHGGDFTVCNRAGDMSICGGVIADRDSVIKHDEPFLLSRAKRGSDIDGAQFFITTAPAPHLDKVNVVFGKVISGKEIVTRIENLEVNEENRPVSEVLIFDCGQLSSSNDEDSEEEEFSIEEGSSSILAAINRIRDPNKHRRYRSDDISALHNYYSYYDDVMRQVGIKAELRVDCLDQGSDITQTSYSVVKKDGVFPGDQAVQVIGKRLGGPGHSFNVVPLNAKLDLSEWKESEEVIYNHLKQANTNTARMLFAFDYDDESEDEFCRLTIIYYHFVLYDGDKGIVGQPIEGVINNPIPIKNRFK